MGYATVADYERLTGVLVPAADEVRIQSLLDLASTLIEVYLGASEPMVAEAYPELLTGLTVQQVYRSEVIPVGIRSEAAGSTSVTYADDNGARGSLYGSVTRILDLLIGGRGGGLSSITFGSWTG